jgi:hypothetical protein
LQALEEFTFNGNDEFTLSAATAIQVKNAASSVALNIEETK